MVDTELFVVLQYDIPSCEITSLLALHFANYGDRIAAQIYFQSLPPDLLAL